MFFVRHGVVVERMMTANAFSYRHGTSSKQLLTDRGVRHIFIKPHCPWTNGKVERFNRTLQAEWGIPAPLDQQQATPTRPGTLAPALQHPTPPHRPAGPSTDQPSVDDLAGRYS